MRGRPNNYSREELAWLEANRTLVIGELHLLFCEEFGRADVTKGALAGLRKRKDWKTGRTGRFAKGDVPANKGRPCPPGVGGRHPNARKTQFPKGHRGGRAAEMYKPIGSERTSKDGYLERKIHDGLPMQSRWRAVHLIEWEAVNGPVPEGHCLKALDGDRTNTDPSNWRCVPRAMMPALNGYKGARRPAYDQAAPEVKPVLLALAEVDFAAGTLKRRKRRAA